MRSFDKVKECGELNMSPRHIAVLVFGSLVLASSTFGVGYLVGSQEHKPVMVKKADVWHDLLKPDAPIKATLFTYEKELQEHNSVNGPTPLKVEPLDTEKLSAQKIPVPSLEKPLDGVQLPTPLPEKQTGYSLQIRAFRNIVEANEFISTLRREGYKPHLVLNDIPGRGRWYRVRVGRFSSIDAARVFQKQFEAKEGIATFVSIL